MKYLAAIIFAALTVSPFAPTLSGQDTEKEPWRTDVHMTRDEAQKAGKPCVLIAYIDAGAL